MLPRTTRKSDRPRVSDRTMVGTAQPLCLSASRTDRRRYESTMNLRQGKTHSVSLHYWGWTANNLCFAVAGEVFVLTSLFIERDYRNVENCPMRPQGHIRIRLIKMWINETSFIVNSTIQVQGLQLVGYVTLAWPFVLFLLRPAASTSRSRDLSSRGVPRGDHSPQCVLARGRKYNLRAEPSKDGEQSIW